MRGKTRILLAAVCATMLFWTALAGLGCDRAGESGGYSAGRVILADTSFMADIVKNVSGEEWEVVALVPLGADPHSYEPAPQEAKLLAESRAIVINSTGLIPQLDNLIAGVKRTDFMVIEAAAGIPGASEDPHVWLDPNNVITYVDNIAEGLATLDPSGKKEYEANAQNYSETLRELDAWIRTQVSSIPPERRLLVTSHESLSYFAKRYGFRIVGTIFPTVSGEGSPSAQQMAALIEDIRAAGAPAIFLETGSNADLALQVARETGVKVVTDLYTASLGEKASTYVEMMRWNVNLIVEALK